MTPVKKPEQQPDEPGDLKGYYVQAREDLAKPQQGMVLRWVFWHAKAVGRVEVARAALKLYETRDWDCHSRALGYMPGSSQHQALMDARPESDVRRAQDFLDQQVTIEQACRSVIDLLKGGR